MIFPGRDVSVFIKKLVSNNRFRYPHLYINRHDWEDWAQEILIHVSNNWHRQHGDKWHAWVKTITRRQIINKIRDRIVASRRMPVTVMLSRVVQEDEWGEEETIYVPDIPGWEDSVVKTRAVLEELPAKEMRFLHAYADLKSWPKVGQAMGISGGSARHQGLRAAARVKATL